MDACGHSASLVGQQWRAALLQSYRMGLEASGDALTSLVCSRDAASEEAALLDSAVLTGSGNGALA